MSFSYKHLSRSKLKCRHLYHKKQSIYEKLLRVTFDLKLTFNQLISDLYKRASRMVNTLAQSTPYINLPK